jgi:hypothetical protein
MHSQVRGQAEALQEQAVYDDHRMSGERDPSQPGGAVAVYVPQCREVVDRAFEDLPAESGAVEPTIAERLPVLATVAEALPSGPPEVARPCTCRPDRRCPRRVPGD